jgi:hypothetical protein
VDIFAIFFGIPLDDDHFTEETYSVWLRMKNRKVLIFRFVNVYLKA